MKKIITATACLLLCACQQPITETVTHDVGLAASAAGSVPSGFLQKPLELRGPAHERLSLRVEVADTSARQELGLMFRSKLEPDTGMLFIFTDENVLNFWMKNTLVPLDVLFFTAAGEFVSVQTMKPCTQDPCPSYASDKPATYALEVPAGYAKEHNVGEGWNITVDQ
ncbi:MAG: hypothetical protein JWM56_134 [Candidatus Peribacteria bacterium]|nr:hypothetical protein [Candidatus Peribacteria bacterium]